MHENSQDWASQTKVWQLSKWLMVLKHNLTKKVCVLQLDNSRIKRTAGWLIEHADVLKDVPSKSCLIILIKSLLRISEVFLYILNQKMYPPFELPACRLHFPVRRRANKDLGKFANWRPISCCTRKVSPAMISFYYNSFSPFYTEYDTFQHKLCHRSLSITRAFIESRDNNPVQI